MPLGSTLGRVLGQVGGRATTTVTGPSTRGPLASRLHDLIVEKILRNYVIHPTLRQWEGVVRRSAEVAPHLKPGEQTLREAARGLLRHPIGTPISGIRQMGTPEKVLFTGLTGWQGVEALQHPETRSENLARTGASALSWAALRRTPLAASLLGLLASGEVAGQLGRLRDQSRARALAPKGVVAW